MFEDEPGGVEERPIEMGDGTQITWHATMDTAVQGVADNRVANCAQMYPNLVRTASMNGDLNKRQHAELFSTKDPRDRFAAPPGPRGLLRAAVTTRYGD